MGTIKFGRDKMGKRTKKAMSAILIASLCVAFMFPLNVNAGEVPNTGEVGVGSAGEKLSADYNYGFSLGEEFGDLYKTVDTTFWEKTNGIWERTALIEKAEKHIEMLKEYYPQRLERLSGLSDALGIPLVDIVAITMFLPSLTRMGCTTTALAPPATNDGQIYTSWNMDVLDPLLLIGIPSRIPLPANLVLFVQDIPGYNKCVVLGIPLIFGIDLLNDKGLTYVANAIGMTDGSDEGLTDFELNNLAMETCSSVDDVVALYERTPKYSCAGYSAGIFMNMNTIWTDPSGNMVGIEHSGHHMVTHYGKDHILASTNHHQYLDRSLSGSPTPLEQKAIAGSYARLGRAWELLEDNCGEIDLDFMKSFTADHERNYTLLREFGDYREDKPVDDDTICCHYWNMPGYLMNRDIGSATDCFLAGTTIFSIIMQPDEFTIWFCPGRPCTFPYIPLYFADLLGVEGPSYTSGVGPEPVTQIANGLLGLENGLASLLTSIPFATEIRRFIFIGLLTVMKVLIPILEKLVPVE